jgi:hypothetical protein
MNPSANPGMFAFSLMSLKFICLLGLVLLDFGRRRKSPPLLRPPSDLHNGPSGSVENNASTERAASERQSALDANPGVLK